MAKRRKKTIKNYPSRPPSRANGEAGQGEAEAGELKITNESQSMPKRHVKLREAEKLEINPEIDKRNKLIMKIGIACVMALIFIIWIFNLKHEFAKPRTAVKVGNGFSWEETRQELDKTMKQVKEGIAQIKQLQKSALPKEAEATPEQIDLLKEKLLQGTGTSTKK